MFSALEELGVNLPEQEVRVRLWEVFFLSVLLRACHWKQFSQDAGRKAAVGTAFVYVCLQIDKNCSGDLMAFTKG